MHKAVFALLLLAPVSALQAQNMPVSEFLAKVEALKKKGPMALFSSDIKLLKAEVQNSGKQFRAEQAALKNAGKKPVACLPEKAATDSDEIVAHFSSIPPQQRSMPVKTAFAALMRKKFPCPA